ncbi:hypothetical protein LSUB1_G008236 [Lachnellula subtilissima]|uniref:Uncharacterized protein n=1 Tax=Lachnellula subtilissima TaxID=602034 RepID=A0A8H8RIJ0_9HELO|nr:hypothetical protein LSUB1_G008236 [Lachnellula subtilissima]
MDMDSVKLDLHALPLETLQQIAGHVDRSHRPSLYAFGLASKTCHSATLPLIFHHIHLSISSREALQRNVNALVTTLSRTASAGHVRYLSIKGSFRLSGASRIEGYKSHTSDRHSWFETTGVDEILGGEEPSFPSPHVVYDEPVIAKSSEEDLAWAPVVGLIQTLPRLSKLVYDCRNQFPPTLLDALHDHHPQCKLYHLTFRLRTLLWGTPYPYEMALASSPCLYSVKVECCRRDSEGDDDFNQEAMMEIVASLAPNLKKVVVVNLTPENSRRYYRRPREPWRGLPGFVSGRSIGSLTSLSLLGAVDLRPPGLLQAWARHTDFSRLRHLALGGGYGCEGAGVNDEGMEWIAQNCSFPRLKTLRIRMQRDDMEAERPNYANNAITFFREFEPLDQLSVSGPLEPKILDAILDQHGPTLKKLTLRPSEQAFTPSNHRVRRDIPMTFTKEHILQIHTQCPALQELAISVKRTKSDTLEAEMYKSFGQMAQLKSLFLTLDCSDWGVMRDADSRDDASFDAFDRESCKILGFLKKGRLRETLMNCAVDETLVRSIWETIYSSKVGRGLESLKVWTTGGGQWGTSVNNASIPPVVNHLSRSWLVERVCRDDGDVTRVKELGRRVREARDQEQTDEYRRRAEYLRKEKDIVMEPGDVEEDSEIMQVFRRVWPRKEGSRDWREDWSSLPL